MKQEIVIDSATRGSVDGTDYASCWAASEELKNEADTVGLPPMKINCDKSVIDALRGKLPALVECDIKMISGSGARSGNFITQVFKVSPVQRTVVKPS